jgi:hypothetical protein
LTHRKFGRTIAPEDVVLPVSLSAERLARKDPDLAAQIKQFQAELSRLSPAELSERVAEERNKQAAELTAKAEAEERARFFNQPRSTADFDYWSRLAHWTLDEALALSLGKAPEWVHWKAIEPYLQISAFALRYKRQRELILRAAAWKQLFDPVMPGFFLAWAKRTDFPVDERLEAAVAARGVQVADWKTLYDELKAKHLDEYGKWLEASNKQDETIRTLREQVEDLRARLASPVQSAPEMKEIGARERESLLKMIIGMAVGGYGFDPKASRSTQATEIAGDLEKAGVGLDADTVRKWLRQATDLLPPKDE